MKTLTALLAALTLVLTSTVIQARGIDPEEVLRLSDAGTLQSSERLDAKALSKHPGASIIGTQLKNIYGRYVYNVELRDAQDIEWYLEIDAATGQVYRNHQDN
ncbi:peptidase [Pseudomonas syringae]|uniref:Peptidase n=1 Tax=Pseudomonas syringae TaxID=317 RepID=A0A244EN99_PSESX|nr:PepSY domain-containing protein [Pseudomonas syringae]MCI3946236.1 peptidase [Pseudomonas syringae]OUM06009.1 peptidase [Pseudomonas syringae]